MEIMANSHRTVMDVEILPPPDKRLPINPIWAYTMKPYRHYKAKELDYDPHLNVRHVYKVSRHFSGSMVNYSEMYALVS